ncbi:serine/threonine protein kinase [Calothrix sp. CCY 0018]|uniref:serine/threonine protein kinase n=1 Tax=Calothrix sp. CCY 0018 TaxID=3103864 RepID=UPI0039C6FFAE
MGNRDFSDNIEEFYYQVYGLTLRSNQPLPGLKFIDNKLSQVEINLTTKEGFEMSHLAEDIAGSYNFSLKTRVTTEGKNYQLCFCGGGEAAIFDIAASGKKISVTWINTTLEEVTALLVGSVMGCALRLQGIPCLHASVIAVDNRAIAIIGAKGAGKSTTAGALAQRGQPILSEEIAAFSFVEEDFIVQPGYPRLRLWTPSINYLGLSLENLKRIFSVGDKRYVELTSEKSASAWRFQDKPLPLAAIYILHNRQSELATPYIESIPTELGLMHLMAHRYPKFLTVEQDYVAREFAFLSSLAARIPIKKVYRPDNFIKLPEVCDVILNDARATISNFVTI